MSEMLMNAVQKIPTIYREYLQDYTEMVVKLYGDNLVSIAVFGSVARGNPKPGSDIDVLLVLRNAPLTANQRMMGLTRINLELQTKDSWKKLDAAGRSGLIAECVFTVDEIKKHPPILLDIIEDGVIIMDRDSLLKKVLSNLRRKLNKLGAKKVKLDDGTWFWVLKPDIKFGESVKI
jgi:hypothetical protein